MNVPINVLEEIALHPLSKQTALIYREAQQFVTEMQTCVWLEKENIEKGRAVSSLELVQQYFHQLKRNEDKYYEEDVLTVGEDFPVENKAGERGIRVVNTMRKWCSRFKKRWQVRHGQMMEREFMPPGELRDKA